MGRNLNRTRVCRTAISPVKRSDREMEVKSESEQQSSEWMIDLQIEKKSRLKLLRSNNFLENFSNTQKVGNRTAVLEMTAICTAVTLEN